MGEPKPLRRLREALTVGNIWLAVLSLMRRKPLYAYALAEEIERTFRYRPSRIMCYLVLYKLEAEGLIKSAFRERRKYYAITAKGKAALIEAKKYLRATAGRL